MLSNILFLNSSVADPIAEDASPEDILRRDATKKATSATNVEKGLWGEQLAKALHSALYCLNP